MHYAATQLTKIVYGGFITNLRGDVRQFYGIDGNENRDFFAGCCNPCFTLIEIENEIIGREKLRKPSDASGYTSHPPMSSSSSSSRSGSKLASPDSERDDCLPCIPEDQCERIHSTPNSRRGSKKRDRSIALDPIALTDATLVHNHDLGKDPTGPTLHLHGNHRLSKDTTTPSYPPSIHQLRTDTKAPASPPAVHRHDLFRDVTEAIGPQGTNHDIGFDPVETYRASPEHLLRQDETAPGVFPTSHSLGHDLVSVQARSARPHILEEDEEVISRPASRGPHHLHEDK